MDIIILLLNLVKLINPNIIIVFNVVINALLVKKKASV